MSSWDGKSKGSATGYGIFIWVLKTLGLRPAYALLRVVVAWYFLFSFRKVGHMAAVHRRLGRGAWSAWRAAYGNFYGLGESILDRVSLMAGIRVPFAFSFDGEEHLRAMLAGGRGGILLSAHLGNWEIAGHLLKRLDTQIHLVLYDAEYEAIKASLEKFAGERQANIIRLSDDLSHIYAMHEALQRNELICMHADRFRGDARTVSLDFLGTPTRFPAGPFTIACKFRVPVSFTLGIKAGHDRYRLEATPPLTCEGRGEEAIRGLCVQYAKWLESRLRLHPKQWFNFYDFWHA